MTPITARDNVFCSSICLSACLSPRFTHSRHPKASIALLWLLHIQWTLHITQVRNHRLSMQINVRARASSLFSVVSVFCCWLFGAKAVRIVTYIKMFKFIEIFWDLSTCDAHCLLFACRQIAWWVYWFIGYLQPDHRPTNPTTTTKRTEFLDIESINQGYTRFRVHNVHTTRISAAHVKKLHLFLTYNNKYRFKKKRTPKLYRKLHAWMTHAKKYKIHRKRQSA